MGVASAHPLNPELLELYTAIDSFELFLDESHQFRLYRLDEITPFNAISFGEALCGERCVSDNWVVVAEYTGEDRFCVDLVTGRCFVCSFAFEPLAFSVTLAEGLFRILEFGGDVEWLGNTFRPAFDLCAFYAEQGLKSSDSNPVSSHL